MPNVAINGLGRIGRAALKILMDTDGLDLVAVNDIADVDNLAYLLKYDTVYGRYHHPVTAADAGLMVDGRRIAAFALLANGWDWRACDWAGNQVARIWLSEYGVVEIRALMEDAGTEM